MVSITPRGDVATEPHVKWVAVLSLQFPPTQAPPPDSDVDAPLPRSGDVTISKPADSASRQLATAWHVGITMTVTFDLTRPVNGQDKSYLKVTATEAIITEMRISTDDTGQSVETITINFHKLTYDEAGHGDDVSDQLPASLYGDLSNQIGG